VCPLLVPNIERRRYNHLPFRWIRGDYRFRITVVGNEGKGAGAMGLTETRGMGDTLAEKNLGLGSPQRNYRCPLY
jgi:hypothetical protein